MEERIDPVTSEPIKKESTNASSSDLSSKDYIQGQASEEKQNPFFEDVIFRHVLKPAIESGRDDLRLAAEQVHKNLGNLGTRTKQALLLSSIMTAISFYSLPAAGVVIWKLYSIHPSLGIAGLVFESIPLLGGFGGTFRVITMSLVSLWYKYKYGDSFIKKLPRLAIIQFDGMAPLSGSIALPPDENLDKLLKWNLTYRAKLVTQAVVSIPNKIFRSRSNNKDAT